MRKVLFLLVFLVATTVILNKVSSLRTLIASLTIAATRPGSIILLHPQYASRHETRQALPLIIATLTAQGYTFMTVQELLGQSS